MHDPRLHPWAPTAYGCAYASTHTCAGRGDRDCSSQPENLSPLRPFQHVGPQRVRRFWGPHGHLGGGSHQRPPGHCVLAIGSINGRGRGGGVETDIPTAAVAEYRDELLWRFRDYGDAALALEAAGLSE